MIINITNGEEFNQYISNKEEGIFIPFNEAMIDGKLIYPLFTNDFIKKRANHHNVTKEVYNLKLNSFFNAINKITKDDTIVLWFGQDTFCQINLLAILTYLEQIKITNKIFLNIIADETRTILKQNVIVTLGTFSKSYISLLKQNKYLKTSLKCINIGIKEYLELKNPKNSISRYIKENYSKLSKQELYKTVFKMTRKYGLGDIQVIQMINENM